MSAKILSKKIKTARTEFGLTQAELALRVGVSAQLISAFESGRIQPEAKYIARIAQFTHKPLYFFTGQKVAEVLDRIDKLAAELQELRKVVEQITEPE